ncbi:MAG: hypothetical protein IJ635_05440 [Bacteroidaceae bacterium]|nr:hypothetical protein [Bacteroidaceae bacterium]
MQNKYIILSLILATMLTAACSDHILDDFITDREEDGMAFSVSTIEQADLIYSMAKTRATDLSADSAFLRANDNSVYPLQGDFPTQLYLHRMPLPLVGIHPHTVSASATTSDTRAPLSEIAGEGINFHDSLTIWGYTDKGRTLFNQTLLKKVQGWRSSVHWPYDKDQDDSYKDPNSMKFYAISPALENLEDLKLETSPAYNTRPSFTYKIPDDPALQRDLLYGESDDINIPNGPDSKGGTTPADPRTENLGQDNKTVELKFKHILTAIRFAQGKMPTGVTIKKIQIKDVRNSGTYTPSSGNSGNGTWETSSSGTNSNPYTIDVDATISTWNAENENHYIDGNQVLFLMPQKFADDATATLSITLTDENSVSHTLTASLATDTWQPGYTVTYKITIGEVASDYYLLVGTTSTPPTTTSEYNSTFTGSRQVGKNNGLEHNTSSTSDGTYTIHSYHNFKALDIETGELKDNYTSHAVPWQVTGYHLPSDQTAGLTDAPDTYTDNKPMWLSEISPSEGGLNQTLTYIIAAQSPETLNHATILGQNQVANSRDLSKVLPDGTNTNGTQMSGRTSANCYIVNAEGSYTFPAVYGNAYNGSETLRTKDNDNSFNPNNIFIDHAGRPITTGNIIKQINYALTSEEKTTALGLAKHLDVTSEEKATYSLNDEDYAKEIVTEIKYLDNHLTAKIIWQDTKDAPNQFNTPVYNTGTQSISFQITASGSGTSKTVQPGNCVIALTGKKTEYKTRYIYDSSNTLKNNTPTQESTGTTAATEEILWTWHIWCTDEVYQNFKQSENDHVNTRYSTWNSTNQNMIVEIENNDGTKTNILPVNLGWVPDNNQWNIYTPREVWVEIAQTKPDNENFTNNQKIHLKIRQEARQDLITGTSTIYQWGRPTALPMVLDINKTERAIYGNNDSDIKNNFKLQNITNFQDAILNPTTLFRTLSDGKIWFETSGNHNYWGHEGVKTIYDPCPPGFRVPQMSVFTGFSRNGQNSASGNGLNMLEDNGTAKSGDKQKGGYMYTVKYDANTFNRYNPTVYIPATGLWQADKTAGTQLNSKTEGSTLYINTSTGFYWTSNYTESTTAPLPLGFWICPQWTYNESGKYAIQFDRTTDFSAAMPIRPSATTP